jgi:hypothetical protein
VWNEITQVLQFSVQMVPEVKSDALRKDSGGDAPANDGQGADNVHGDHQNDSQQHWVFHSFGVRHSKQKRGKARALIAVPEDIDDDVLSEKRIQGPQISDQNQKEENRNQKPTVSTL